MKKIAIIGCGKIFLKHYEAIKIQEKRKKCDLLQYVIKIIHY